MTDKRILLTDFVPRYRHPLVDPEDVWSCSEPDAAGRVVAVVRVGDALLQVEGRRVFEMKTGELTVQLTSDAEASERPDRG